MDLLFFWGVGLEAWSSLSCWVFFAIDDFFTFSHGQSLFEELPIGSPPTILSTGVSVVHHELKKAFPPREVTLFTVPQWDHAIWPSLETDLKLQRERSEEKHEEMNTATSRENGGGGNFNKDTSKNTGVPDTWAIIVASRRWGHYNSSFLMIELLSSAPIIVESQSFGYINTYKYHLWWVRGEHRKVFLKSLKEIWVDEWRGWWEDWCSQKVNEPPQGSMKPYQIVWYTQKHILEVGYSLHNGCVYTPYILVFWWWIGVSINEGLESVHCSIWIHFEFDDFWGPVTRGCAWWKMPKACGVFKPSAWQKSLHSEFATFSIGLSSRGLSAIESRQGLTFKCFFWGGHGTKWSRASCPPSKIAQLHFREHVFRIPEAISASLVTEVARPSFQHTFRRNRGSAKEGWQGMKMDHLGQCVCDMDVSIDLKLDLNFGVFFLKTWQEAQKRCAYGFLWVSI